MNTNCNLRFYLLTCTLWASLIVTDTVKGEGTNVAKKDNEPTMVLSLPGPKLEGVNNKKVEVKLERMELTDAGSKLKGFLSLGTGATAELAMHTYKLSSEEPYWLDYMSSMGSNSRELLLSWIGSSMLKEFRGEQAEVYFEDAPSLLKLFLGGAPKKQLIEASGLWADFIGELLSPYERTAAIDRPVYSTSFKLCPFSHKEFSIILVDPTPHSGPETFSYLIIIESIYSE